MSSGHFNNLIRDRLQSGDFLYTLEYVPDVCDGSGRKGLDFLEREARAVGLDTRIAGVNIGDRVSRLDTLDTVDCGLVAATSSGKLPLLHLAGKNYVQEQALERFERAKSLGLSNFLLITGDRVVTPEGSGRTRYYDSVNAIVDARRVNPHCLVAAAVSPFKYREEELINQYLKMAKKLNVGADYLITNCGWDMRKFQELAWYCRARGFSVPLVANILMPPLKWAKGINAGRLPGVHLSDDLLVMLETEHKLGRKHFADCSVRRMALQIVGLKLMGYRGVHMSAVETYEELCKIIETADELEKQLPTLSEWERAWNEVHTLSDGRSVQFAPADGLFLFDKPPAANSMTAPPIIGGVSAQPTEVRKRDVLDAIDHLLFKDGAVGTAILKPVFQAMDRTSIGRRAALKLEEMIKKPVLGCESCGFCRIPYLEYVCPETCPKGLANGPCSGTDDNVCEFKDRECIHNRKYRIAKAKGHLADLETVVVPPVTNTRGTSSWINQYQKRIPVVQTRYPKQVAPARKETNTTIRASRELQFSGAEDD